MSIPSALIQQTQDILLSLGKTAVHSLAPNNYEYYLCSFELYDSSINMIGLFSFSVMPNNIMESETQIANITKTNRSLVTSFNTSFVPKDISLQGNFGRKLRIIIGDKEVGKLGRDLEFGNLVSQKGQKSIFVKTGYGMTKTLEKIIKASWKLDASGLPCFLVFRNYSLNHHYIVEVMQHSFSQSVDMNMIWNYSLELKAVADAKVLFKQENKNILKSKAFKNAAALGLNKMISSVKRSIMRF